MSDPATGRIVLIGMMGSGKSTVGRLVAERIGWRYVDNDDVVRALSGREPAGIATDDGEDALHAFEAEALLVTLRSETGVVVSAAAWVVLDDACREALAAEPHVDVGRRHPRIGAGDDVPLDGAGELVVDPSCRDDDPGAGDGKAHAQPLALVRGPGAPGRERSDQCGPENHGERERAADGHNGLRVHASERPDATSNNTTPTPANAAVTSRFSRLEPIRLPRSL